MSSANLPEKGSQSTTNPFVKPNPFANFANLNLPSNTQSSSSLFGNTNSTASNATQQQTSTSNLFGNNAQSTQTQPPPSGGLFGGLANNQTQQQNPPKSQGSLFGGLGQQNTQQNSGLGSSASFNTTTQSGPLAPSQDVQPPQSGLIPSAPTALFQNLLERGKKRTAESDSNLPLGGLPSLQLGLSDIANKVRNLGGSNGFSKVGKGADTKAHYLLAASGVPRASTLRDLDEFPIQGDVSTNALAPGPPDVDVDAYVMQLQAKSNEDLLNEYMEQTKRDFDTFIEERYHMNLGDQRRRIYEHFGLARPSEHSTQSRSDDVTSSQSAFGRVSRRIKDLDIEASQAGFGTSSMSRSVLGQNVGKQSLRQSLFSDVAERQKSNMMSPKQEAPLVRTKQERYSASVRELNSNRLQGLLYPVIEEFAKIETEIGNNAPQHLIDAYKALGEITRENKNARSPVDFGAVRERQYAKDYLEASNPVQRLALRKQILNGSKKHLEDSFWSSVEDVITSNPADGHVGGIPSKVNKLRAYVRIRVKRKDLGPENDRLQKVGEDHCWVLIYFLLRAGLVEEAEKYITENERAIKSIDRQFPQYMATYAKDPDRRLTRYLQQRIESEYSARAVEESIDPYRLACLKVVGRCNLGSKNLTGVSSKMEDWIWMVLSLAREVPRTEETSGESFNLGDAQELIDNIGERHFQGSEDAMSGYATFFLLQILVGMFEKAVAWLHMYNHVAAAHFAIALSYYGLLRTADFDPNEARLLTRTTTDLPQLSFARLLGYYTREFRTAQPESATDYLTMIALDSDLPGAAGRSHTLICQEALKELVLETREFTTLLGDMLQDGKRAKGAIEQRLPLIKATDEDDFMKTLTLQAASVAEDSGRTTDAVLLYHLAEMYDKAILLVNRVLSEALSVEHGRGNLRLQSIKPGKPTDNRQNEQPNSTSSLSLTSVDDPATLAKKMSRLYNSDAMYYEKIPGNDRKSCGLLIRMTEIKDKIEAANWADALALINALQLLPLDAKGDISIIRSTSQAFNSLPQVIARTIGNLLLWTIMCLGRKREEDNNSGVQMRRLEGDELLTSAKDMMVFAGLIRYKLPPDVFEVLARAGQDIGAY